ncbi:hypothetical protein [Microbacterium sp. SLBN-146]|uniref:hypothetical protein n=1 Tax=Microbacterium sp. SLBN-146 TaxID=2768457 RepID=UPI0011524293|nr:hypothetical protein [Microbacterium sp. SLBN-146]TQJ32353.1 hypothetical protein FBY39_2859 [Microbacterium sp. SLBN-146]
MSDHQDENIGLEGDQNASSDVRLDETPQYGVGPFSVREVALAGVWLVAFVLSFFPVAAVLVGRDSLLFGFGSVWTTGLGWILTIGLPTIAVFLIGLRRLSPDGIRRVGSLGIDQFASVAFSVSAVVWLQIVWETVAFTLAGGDWFRSWVIWAQLILMLAGVLLTVFAPLIPPFAQDFVGRREVPAHRNARPVRPVSARPARPADPSPAPAAAPTADTGSEHVVFEDSADVDATTESWMSDDVTGAYEPVDQVEAAADEPAAHRHQAFWALVPEERDVVDDSGAALFRIGPTAWALVIEEYDDHFVVRHEDGRVGRLHDTDGVTRG